LINKIDLVIWAKNGSKTLPFVLKRINESIPEEVVNNRIFVDDHSVDDSREIAKSFGWHVVFNDGRGISNGANTALRRVTSEFFISFEQDLFLAKEWWNNVPQHILNERVAVASGIRVSSLPGFRELDEYIMEEYERKNLIYPTLDNTIYKTKIIKKFGFPKLSISAGIDIVLVNKLFHQGYLWKVDYNVKSIHLRSSLREELKHRCWYGACLRKLDSTLSIQKQIGHLLFSPIRALDVAIKKRNALVAYIYPLTRFYYLRGILISNKV
jgi:glycosyltransferase involved in cell wall biosynthesis